MELEFSHTGHTNRKSAADGGLFPMKWVTASGNMPVRGRVCIVQSIQIELNQEKVAFHKMASLEKRLEIMFQC